MSADAGPTPASADAESTAASAGGPDELPEWLSLDEGETVEWVGQPASISLVPAAIWGVILLPVLGLGALVFASAYLTVTNTDYVVTNTTLYHKRGVLSTNIESVGLDRIQNTEYSQSFFGTQFGYGTIDISTAGSSGADVTFGAIEQPREVRDLINRLANAAGGTGGMGGRSDPSGEGAAQASAGGVDEELLQELLTELRAVNESMATIERALADESGGSRADPGGRRDDGEAAAGGGGSAPESASDSDDDTPPTPFGGDGG